MPASPLHSALPRGRVSGGILLATAAAAWVAPAAAEPTAVTVRVISQDAKFVGDGTGGAHVVLRDAAGGDVLATGVTRGGTGNTGRIMDATGRSALRADDDTAAFTATVDIDRPMLVTLEVEGPLARPEAMIRVTSQRWMMPGEPVTGGDGWVVELPGLAITPSATPHGGKLNISAKVEPMCGCPITPGGLWDAGNYRVSASLWRGGQRLTQGNLRFASSPGTFAGELPSATDDGDETGGKTEPVMLVVFARNVITGNTGLARMPLPAPVRQ